MACLVFVFDFDGVLVRSNEIRETGVRALLEALELGGHVYIVTGRRLSDRGYVRSILEEAGINLRKLKKIYLRGQGSEIGFKHMTYREIHDVEGCIGEIHDDNPEALWPARRLVEHGLILHYNEYCEAIYGYTILRSCRNP